MTDEKFSQMMTEGILGAAGSVRLGDVELAADPSGAVVPRCVFPMAPAVLTDGERVALSEALGL